MLNLNYTDRNREFKRKKTVFLKIHFFRIGNVVYEFVHIAHAAYLTRMAYVPEC